MEIESRELSVTEFFDERNERVIRSAPFKNDETIQLVETVWINTFEDRTEVIYSIRFVKNGEKYLSIDAPNFKTAVIYWNQEITTDGI